MKFGTYLIGQYLKVFFLIFLSGLAVFLLIDFVGNIETWLSKDPKEALRYYLFYLPQVAYLVAPIVVLLSSVIVLGGLARHLEIAAMKAAGVPVLRQIMPVLMISFAICVGLFYLSDRILPDANHERLQIAQPKTRNVDRNKREVDKYQFVFVGLGQSSYYFQHYSAKDSSGEQVTFFVQGSGEIKMRWDADKAIYRKHQWILVNGQQRNFNASQQLSWFKFDTMKLQSKDFPECPSDLLDTRFKADEMSLAQMDRKIQLLQHAGEDTREMETQWHFRFASAMISFFVALFGISLSHGVVRGGLANGIMMGLGYAFLYYVGLKFGVILGSNGTCPPWLGAWLANIGFGLLSTVIFWRSIRL